MMTIEGISPGRRHKSQFALQDIPIHARTLWLFGMDMKLDMHWP